MGSASSLTSSRSSANGLEGRVIPCLLLDGDRLVKTVRFADPAYIGDPVNVLSIFNDFEVDEIVILDIGGCRSRQPAPLSMLERLAEECFIPLAYGGGLSTLEEMQAIHSVGVEKLVLNTALLDDPALVRAAVATFGAQAVVASIDARRADGTAMAFVAGGRRPTGVTAADWARAAVDLGVGEILLTDIEREGSRRGFDVALVAEVARAVPVPVIAHGGAGHRTDLAMPIQAGAAAVAAGSLFFFQGDRGSVLVNYPSRPEIRRLFGFEAEAAVSSTPSLLQRRLDGIELGRDGDDLQRCARCLYDSAIPGITFTADGVCSCCQLHDVMDAQYPTGTVGEQEMQRVVEEMKAAGRGKPYDCIVGVSGGCDSSFLVHEMVERGIRPLAVHFDNTWNSPVATHNIYAVLDALEVPLETYVVDNTEYDDIYRSFMLAGVRDIEAPTDIGFMGVLYRAAQQHGIKHIVEGHSFRTEGVSPLGWLYMDGGYIRDVHRRFGSVPLKTYPNMEFTKFVRWAAFSRINRVRPLYHLDYRKEDTKAFLAERYGWQWYGGHHLENRFTGFYHTYFLPTRFGLDFRQIELSALVRSGQLGRAEAERQLAEPRQPDPELLAMVKKRLGFDDEEFESVMAAPRLTYRDYRTYKRRFEALRPFFWLMYKLDRVPKSFYVKFCQRAAPP